MNAAQFLASKTSQDLIEMLKASDDRAVTAAISDEIERRHPEVAEALNVWEFNLETTETYTDVIVRVLA